MDMIEKAIDTILKERNWHAKVNIAEPWKKAEEDGIEGSGLPDALIAELRRIAAIPSRLLDIDREGLNSLIDEFEMLGEDDEASFDMNMQDLYDWADANSVWVGAIG